MCSVIRVLNCDSGNDFRKLDFTTLYTDPVPVSSSQAGAAKLSERMEHGDVWNEQAKRETWGRNVVRAPHLSN
ncbi:MAG: hypothetical protein CMQ21_02995 [Gammaproteobacteria bacterium]|nr:hypothetical protein [Gammaproteobacteria bacterium]